VVTLAENTTVTLPGGGLQITVIQLADQPDPPAASKVIEAYSFEPVGATFIPAASVTIKYDAAGLPKNVKESNLYLALLENSKWTALATTVDTKSRTLTAKVSHFSTYAMLGKVTVATTTPATSNTTVPISPTSNITAPSGNVTDRSSDTVTSGMAVPVLVIIIAGGLLVIGLGIAFVFKRS